MMSDFLTHAKANERGLRSVERIKEVLKVGDVPAGFKAFAASENGISDLYMNLNRQLADGALPARTKVLVALGVAAAFGSRDAVDFFSSVAAAAGRTEDEMHEAVAAAIVCQMFNGYYRFRHQVPAEDVPAFEAFKAPFNANSFVKSTLPPEELEAVCIAVSSANNCHKCIEGHTAKARSLG